MSLEQIRAFLEASDAVGFEGRNRAQVYGWVNKTLRQQRYQEATQRGRGLVRRYITGMTGLSLAQGNAPAVAIFLRRRSEAESVSPTSPPAPLHAGGYLTAGSGGRGARDAQRASHAEDSAASLLRFPGASILAPGGIIGGPVVPVAVEPCVSASHRADMSV